MYIYGEKLPVLRPDSSDFHRLTVNGIGDAAADTRRRLKALTPDKLKLVDHYHVPRTIPGGAVGVVTRLVPHNMNAGLISPITDELLFDRSANGLQTLLERLIRNKYQKFLSSKRSTQVSASAGDRIRIALVDLTAGKLFKPDFAGWGSVIATEGASLSKICVLYAVHQLRMDLDQLARKFPKRSDLISLTNTIWSNANFSSRPKLDALFDFPADGSRPFLVKFNDKTRKTLKSVFADNCNCAATRLILQVGFNYLASVLWQSGLRHPTKGGLWLRGGYCCVDNESHCEPGVKKNQEVKNWLQADSSMIVCRNGKGNSVTWSGNPVSQPKEVFRHNATALSAAAFYTLLAQGRLVDARSSTEMNATLTRGCSISFGSATRLGFREKLDELGGMASSPGKCGIDDRHLHESMLVRRGRFRYVVVALTIDARDFPFGSLINDLDKLIQDKNP